RPAAGRWSPRGSSGSNRVGLAEVTMYESVIPPIAVVDDGEPLLVAALCRGDEAAFEELLDRYHPSMIRLALPYVRGHAEAAEVGDEPGSGRPGTRDPHLHRGGHRGAAAEPADDHHAARRRGVVGRRSLREPGPHRREPAGASPPCPVEGSRCARAAAQSRV